VQTKICEKILASAAEGQQSLSEHPKIFKKVANTFSFVCAIYGLMDLHAKFCSPQFASPHTLFRLLSYTASYFLA
jgi:hypothetical protein